MASGYAYVWLLWSSAFLVPWALVYALAPAFRPRMLRVSFATSLLGLTEPIFVPEYWNPPSLFGLAQRTGFDLESLIFCFAIGGLGAFGYHALAGRALVPMPQDERLASRHRFHRLALAAPFVAFPPLYLLPWNPIYAGIAALVIGGIANVLCRPDLARNALIGGALFAGLYAVFMILLIVSAPGYVEQVWNLSALSGWGVGAIPLEELAFGFGFGMYWAGIYEHFAWHRGRPAGHRLDGLKERSAS
jgi:hypothetical protein